MSNFWRRILALAAVTLALGLGTAAWRFLSQARILTVAVGPANGDDAEFVNAWARALSVANQFVRVKVLPTSGPVESLEKLKNGEASLAVVRSDVAATEKIRAVALLHSDPVVIAAPANARIDDFGKLNGKSLGVIGPPMANDALVDALRRHYRVNLAVIALPPAPAQIAAALREKKADALLFVAPASRGAAIADGWTATRRALGKSLAFTPIEDNDAIAEASPAYESGEIPAGLFGGSPLLPPEDIATLRAPTYLVADRGVADRIVGALTRSLFEDRQTIAVDSGLANLVKSASVDKDAAFPIHPGARAFYDGEETSLVEQYGDWLYYGPVLLGAVASAAMAALRFLGFKREEEASDGLLGKVPEVIARIKNARSVEELDEIRARIDKAVERFALGVTRGSVGEAKTPPLALAVDYLGRMIAERRREIMEAASK